MKTTEYDDLYNKLDSVIAGLTQRGHIAERDILYNVKNTLTRLILELEELKEE